MVVTTITLANLSQLSALISNVSTFLLVEKSYPCPCHQVSAVGYHCVSLSLPAPRRLLLLTVVLEG